MSEMTHQPLSGIKIVEIAGGAAAAYCGRLLADAGASVTLATRYPTDPGQEEIRDANDPVERLYARYLTAGKSVLDRKDADVAAACADADLVIVGEDADFDPSSVKPRLGVVDLTWFGARGPYCAWAGSDLVIEALTAMPHLAGDADGPPVHSGDRHATVIAGATCYLACMVAILSKRASAARRFQVNILEANMILSEMDVHFVERDGQPLKRYGVNQFWPNGPVGIYPCKDGWIGIIATTPEQWLSLCQVLENETLASDAGLATREQRFLRIDEVEAVMREALKGRTPQEWAERGRKYKVPMVVVPNAAGILDHPIFKARQSLATFEQDGVSYQVPRTPFGLTRSPTSLELDAARQAPAKQKSTEGEDGKADPSSLLEDITVVDFSMGWAGPLASRLMADFGANVLKIEAGRYPDWWRGVNWSTEYIESKQYEQARGFCALNRGKRGVSIDLTTEAGRNLALSLVAGADAIVENQAAGVMRKLGLGYDVMQAANPNVVMLSMSAFGTDNAWSDTRAYGSTLEQGSGLPSFTGFEGKAPTMAHLAYGDPVGGLFGCAALLTALVHRKRTGTGQLVNLSMIESMLQFTTPSLLNYQVSKHEPKRLGNRHRVFSPHGIFACEGEDKWVAIAVTDARSFKALANVIGRTDLAADKSLEDVAQRRRREGEIEQAVSDWAKTRQPEDAADELQAAGVSAAPAVHTEHVVSNKHLDSTGFFIDLQRELSGAQRQCGFGITQDGRRLGARRPAPLLGEHSVEVLRDYAGVDANAFQGLMASGVVSYVPTSLRGTILPSQAMPPARKTA